MSELELWNPEKHHVPRHGRTRAEALDDLRSTRRWGADHAIEVEVSHLGHHWKFHTTNMRHVAEWWPSSGRLVIEAKYKKSLYAPSLCDVLSELEKRWLKKVGTKKGE